MAKKDFVALVDFDDSLFFTRHLVGYATKEILGKPIPLEKVRKMDKSIKHKIYDLAQTKYWKRSKPNRILIKELGTMNGSEIVIMTARAKTQREATLAVIKEYGVPFDRLFMRNKAEMKMEDEEWKLQQIKRFMKRYERVNYYEDKMENLMYVKKIIGKSKRLSLFLILPGKIKRVS